MPPGGLLWVYGPPTEVAVGFPERGWPKTHRLETNLAHRCFDGFEGHLLMDPKDVELLPEFRADTPEFVWVACTGLHWTPTIQSLLEVSTGTIH